MNKFAKANQIAAQNTVNTANTGVNNMQTNAFATVSKFDNNTPYITFQFNLKKSFDMRDSGKAVVRRITNGKVFHVKSAPSQQFAKFRAVSYDGKTNMIVHQGDFRATGGQEIDAEAWVTALHGGVLKDTYFEVDFNGFDLAEVIEDSTDDEGVCSVRSLHISVPASGIQGLATAGSFEGNSYARVRLRNAIITTSSEVVGGLPCFDLNFIAAITNASLRNNRSAAEMFVEECASIPSMKRANKKAAKRAEKANIAQQAATAGAPNAEADAKARIAELEAQLEAAKADAQAKAEVAYQDAKQELRAQTAVAAPAPAPVAPQVDFDLLWEDPNAEWYAQKDAEYAAAAAAEDTLVGAASNVEETKEVEEEEAPKPTSKFAAHFAANKAQTTAGQFADFGDEEGEEGFDVADCDL